MTCILDPPTADTLGTQRIRGSVSKKTAMLIAALLGSRNKCLVLSKELNNKIKGTLAAIKRFGCGRF